MSLLAVLPARSRRPQHECILIRSEISGAPFAKAEEKSKYWCLALNDRCLMYKNGAQDVQV